MHSITTRAPTVDEAKAIRRLSRPDFVGYGCLTILFAIIPAYVLGLVGGWIVGIVSPDAGQWARYAAWVGVGIFLTGLLVQAFRSVHHRRRRNRRDFEAQLIQEIHVLNPRVVDLTLVANEPILAFDIGDEQILFLQGNSIRDHLVYKTDETKPVDSNQDYFNWLPPPYAFPSTEFTIMRLPYSGYVFGIQVSGEYINPQRCEAAVEEDYTLGDSELFAGRLDDIAELLKQEHMRREAEHS